MSVVGDVGTMRAVDAVENSGAAGAGTMRLVVVLLAFEGGEDDRAATSMPNDVADSLAARWRRE